MGQGLDTSIACAESIRVQQGHSKHTSRRCLESLIIRHQYMFFNGTMATGKLTSRNHGVQEITAWFQQNYSKCYCSPAWTQTFFYPITRVQATRLYLFIPSPGNSRKSFISVIFPANRVSFFNHQLTSERNQADRRIHIKIKKKPYSSPWCMHASQPLILCKVETVSLYFFLHTAGVS